MADQNTMTKAAAEEIPGAEHTRSGFWYRPSVDILENPEELTILADVPGATPHDIALDFKDGTLTIHAKVSTRQDPATQYLLHEYGVGDYWRTFQVSEAVDASKISAEYANGVLTLHLPKAEAAKPRKISVKTQ
jgi:HSP20 family molecular chaperone IbpA